MFNVSLFVQIHWSKN